jgi:hypothetical protein
MALLNWALLFGHEIKRDYPRNGVVSFCGVVLKKGQGVAAC